MMSNELYHHGILGMHWGIRRYQPYPSGSKNGKEVGKAAKSGKVISGGKRSKKAQQKKLKKRVNARLKEKEKAEQTAKEREQARREHEAGKADAIKRGSASQVMKYKGELSNQELQSALTRIRMENELSKYSQSEMKSNWDKMDAAMSKVGTINKWTTIGIQTYKNADQIMKMLNQAGSSSGSKK